MWNRRKGSKSGYIEIFCGMILLLAGVWLFSQTWGFRLLTVDVWIGRISRYYGVFWLIASICFAAGFWSIVHRDRSSEKEDALETDEDIIVQVSRQINCPICGKLNVPLNKFCTFCGSRIEGAVEDE